MRLPTSKNQFSVGIDMQTTMDHWHLPFFDRAHVDMAQGLNAWCSTQKVDETHDRLACREWVDALGHAGWLKYCVPKAFGGVLDQLDSRSLVIARETLSVYSALADFSFAMQGLGSGAITLEGTPSQQEKYLPLVSQGKAIAAFALSEEGAGSDVASMSTTALKTEDGLGSMARRCGSAMVAWQTFTWCFAKQTLLLVHAASQPLSLTKVPLEWMIKSTCT